MRNGRPYRPQELEIGKHRAEALCFVRSSFQPEDSDLPASAQEFTFTLCEEAPGTVRHLPDAGLKIRRNQFPLFEHPS